LKTKAGKVKITSRRSSLVGSILIPASKSHTIRAVAFATMADGISVLKNPLMSDDARSALAAARVMGAVVNEDSDWTIEGISGRVEPAGSYIDVGNSGTSLRIFTALSALFNQAVKFDGDDSIRQRPMMPLLSALETLGVKIVETTSGKCPFIVQGPIKGGSTRVNGISSQFLTALLIACPIAEGDTEIFVDNLNERPYVEMTLAWLKKFNIEPERQGLEHFFIKGGHKYNAFEMAIPGDFSSAAFPLCAASITGSSVLIRGLDFSDHQGDKEVFSFLSKMGIDMKHSAEGVLVKGGKMKGIDIDMNNTPDALPAMAVAGCMAEGTTRLLNVPQARLKECDRIAATAAELKKMGADIEELEDGLVIRQSRLKGTNVHGYNDHRMVMALAVAGLSADGETVVDTANAVGVTYPGFVKDMQSLGAELTITEND